MAYNVGKWNNEDVMIPNKKGIRIFSTGILEKVFFMAQIA